METDRTPDADPEDASGVEAGGDDLSGPAPGKAPSTRGETLFTHRSPDPDTAPTLAPDDVAPPPPTRVSAGAPAEEAPDASGERTMGPYRILDEVGRGGMGVVYRAHHPALARTVALKALIAGEDASPEAIARFHREAAAVAKLGHHPGIVPVHDIGRAGRLHYFAMHFVKGKPLDRLIEDEEVTPRRAARIAMKVARALHHAHRHGILHRDIKPPNILVTPEGEPQITDFGLARDVESDDKVTRSGTTLGTPHYMPPEQAEGRLEDIDARSDLYSLGATLYEMLTTRPPFEGDMVANIIRQLILEEPERPRKRNPAVDRDLETICLKCLEKEPARRYPDAGALADDLERYLASRPIHARPISRLARLWKRARRNKVAAFSLVASLVLLIVLAGVTLGPASVTIRSDPPGARVYLSGRDTGWTTPVTSRLLWPPGRREIVLRREGYDPAAKEIGAGALAANEVSFTLVEDHGFFVLKTGPAKAGVVFLVEGERRDGGDFLESASAETSGEGEAAEVRSVRRYRLPKGAHGLEIAAAGFETHRTTLFVSAGETGVLAYDLRRATGVLNAVGFVKDASMKAILLEPDGSSGRSIAFRVPAKGLELATGRWRLIFEKAGHRRFYATVRIKPGEKTTIHYILGKKH